MLVLDAGAFVAVERGDRDVVAPIDDLLGRRAGTVLARSGRSDAIDAAVVCLARDGDDILTSDPGDLRDLAQAVGINVELIPV